MLVGLIGWLSRESRISVKRGWAGEQSESKVSPIGGVFTLSPIGALAA
jgi:hypothetical protein